MTAADEVFGAFADDYDRHRPDYPEALWEALLAPGFVASVDLGCGTGRASLELARRGVEVVGVDPELGMLRVAREAAEREQLAVEFRQGSAERIPVPDASADLVTAAQAFHWCDPVRALPEVRRVLRPGATLALWWNDRAVDGVPFMEEYEALVERVNPDYRRGYRQRDWAGLLAADGGFTEVRREAFAHSVASDVEGFIGYASTVSYVRNVLSPEELETFRSELRALLRRHHGVAPFEIPYETRLYRAYRPAAP